MTELYQNLIFETLGGRRKPQFEKILHLSSHINLKLQESIISNLYDKDKTAAKDNEKVDKKYHVLEQRDTHEKAEEQIGSDILNNVLYEHKEIDKPYIEPTSDDVLKV